MLTADCLSRGFAFEGAQDLVVHIPVLEDADDGAAGKSGADQRAEDARRLLLVRGPNVMKGYFKRPEENAQAFTKDGGFKTGDMGYVDVAGFVYIMTTGAGRWIVVPVLSSRAVMSLPRRCPSSITSRADCTRETGTPSALKNSTQSAVDLCGMIFLISRFKVVTAAIRPALRLYSSWARHANSGVETIASHCLSFPTAK